MRALMQAMRESLTPHAETVALLEELAQRAVPVYCLSNMPTSTWNYLRARDDFWKRFHGIVISAHVKLLKPERAIYRYLLQTHRLVPEQTVFIDDVAANVAGAREAGIHAIEFRGAADCRVQLERLLAD